MKSKYGIYIFTIILITLLILYPINEKIYIDGNKLKGSLVVWTTEGYYDYFKEISNKIEEENKNVKIEIISINKEGYLEKIENTKEEDLPNIGVLNFQQIDKLKNKISIKVLNMDIIQNYNKNFNECRLEEIKEENNSGFLGVPFTSNPIVLYFESQVLEKYNLKNEDIKTWNDLIKIGEIVKDKSKGEYNIFSVEDEKNIKYLILAQLVDKVDENLSKEEIINKLKSIYKDDYIAREGEKPIFRFSSIDFFNNNIYKEGEWISVNPPTINKGENKFFDIGGDNLVTFKIDKNEELIENFIINSAINKENLFNELEKYNFMPSSLYAIKIKGKEDENKETLSILTNIVEKAPKIEKYKLFRDINKEINY